MASIQDQKAVKVFHMTDSLPMLKIQEGWGKKQEVFCLIFFVFTLFCTELRFDKKSSLAQTQLLEVKNIGLIQTLPILVLTDTLY